MASRRLALNLSQGLRNRASLNAVAPLRRGFATPVVKNGVKTESTTLSNGLTVSLERQQGSRCVLTCDRLLLNTLLGRRRRRSVCGLMLGLGQRRTKQMAQLTSSNILPSRYDPIGLTSGIYRTDEGFRVQAAAHNTNWSSKSRTWVAT